ncbi:MAG TPA: prenyltransferase [Anaerolineae bacterium]
MEATHTERVVAQPVYKNWKYILDTCGAPKTDHLDPISRFLLIIRPCVFQMTLTSGMIGALIAAAHLHAESLPFNWLPFLLSLLGLVIAHAVNNMVNDYFDTEAGVDTEDYVRAQYTTHPILGGLISKSGLRNLILVANFIDILIGVAILLYWGLDRGWPLILFALGGLFVSVFYVAPPIRLKHRGLGEAGVFAVWGPLMIGGTYYAVAGSIRPEVFLACIPYALVVTTVLIGKHIDKIKDDTAKRIHTLPVLLGETTSLRLNKALMISFYVITVALALVKVVGPWVLLSLLALPRLNYVLGIYSKPRPERPPENYAIWPLWYVAAAFYHNKPAGGFFVLGLILNLLIPVQLPF